MRACVVGGGLAGSLLAWRLASAAAGWRIELVTGPAGGRDATALSGGAVRAYEPLPEQRRLATVSMVELLASQTLRGWADFRRVDSLYLPEAADAPRNVDALNSAAGDIELLLPGSVQLVDATELGRDGWVTPNAQAVAIRERHAGYLSPNRLREAVLTDGGLRRRVRVRQGSVSSLQARSNGLIECVIDGEQREYDVVVLAAGAWTAAILQSFGLDGAGYRTKSIQYGIYPTGAWRPCMFVDEATGLYGRPVAEAELLLGLATQEWDVPPDRPPTTPELHRQAAQLATADFPKLRLGPVDRVIGSADCYSDPPVLSLRPVDVRPMADGEHRLFTFTGGSGGSVKMALAASHRAAVQLVDSHTSPPVIPGQLTTGHVHTGPLQTAQLMRESLVDREVEVSHDR